MKKTIKLIELIFCFLLFVTVLPIAADEAVESAKEDISLAQNESVKVKVDQAVSWKIRDPHAADEDKRQLLIGKGDTLTIKYSLAQNMLAEKTAVFFACNEKDALLKEYHVTFTDAVHKEEVFVPSEKAGGHQKVEPPCGYEVMSDGTHKPFPGSPLALYEGFIATSDKEEALEYLKGLKDDELKRLNTEVQKRWNELENYHKLALAEFKITQSMTKATAATPMMLKAAGEPIKLEVVYHYQNENGQIVKDDEGKPIPIAPGWYLDNPDVTQTYKVTFHDIQGYQANIQDADGTTLTPATEYEFKPENNAYVSKTVTVVYVPQEVSYTVKVYKENLIGGYDETTLTGDHKAKTGSQINMQELCDANHADGFTDPYYHEVPRVMGDGSTVAKIYLDRAYFLMDFDLGEGGYGVEPVYAKYGATLPTIGTPTRPGYTFKGWKFNGESAIIPTNMPAEDRKYVADWEMNTPVNVTVNIWGEEANTTDYELIDSNTIQAQSGQQLTQDALNAGLTEVDANLWVYEKTEPNPLPEVNPDGSTVVNVYYKRTLKTLTFNPTGSTMTKWVASDTKAEDWADGGTDSDHRPKWDVDYTWTASDSNASQDYTCTVKSLKSYLDQQNADPQEGDTVEYEYVSTARYSQGFFGIGAGWKETKKTMHFVFKDGEWYVGEEKEVPAEPFYTITAKWGSNIASEWDAACTAGSCHNWSEKTNGSSPWTSGVRVMFDRDINYYKGSDSGGGTSQATYWGEKLDVPGEYELIYTATADGSGLIVSDEDRLQFEGYTYEKGTSNGSSYNGAKFYYTRNTYKVIYVNSPSPNHEKDAKFEQPLNTDPYNNYTPDYPSNLEPGMYTFGGWYLDPSCTVEMVWTNETMPAKNITVYAAWNPITHKVTFRPNESDQIPDTPNATVAHNALIPESAVPTYDKTHFTFVGWFYKIGEEEHAFKPDMPVKRDMDLYAKWKATGQYSYTVNYVLEGSEQNPIYVAEPTVGIGEPGKEFTINAKHGYIKGNPNANPPVADTPSELFWEYWQFFTPTVESQDVTLDADGKEFTFYYTEATATINYVSVTPAQGTVSPTTETIGKVTGKPTGSTPTPVTNYKFVGWYTDEACTQPVPESWVDADNKLTPQRTYDAGVPTTGTSTLWVFEDKTYYAKFELDVADLKVTKSVTDGKFYNEKDIFIFTITGPDNVSMELTIKASELENGSKSVVIHGLKVGTYTVKEDTGWSWRYECTSPEGAEQTLTLQANGTNEAKFTNTLSNEQWLSASARAINEFGKDRR